MTTGEENQIAPEHGTNSTNGEKPGSDKLVEVRRVRRTMREDCFGPRRSDSTHWRCKRLEGDRVQTLLFWGEKDIEESEWPIETLSIETIRDRWGGGRYIVEFYGTNSAGARVQRGKSSIVHLREVEQVIDVPKARPAPAQAAMMPTPQLGSGGDLQTVISLLAFLEDRNEKNRTSAAAEAKVALERHKIDAEIQLQRERLASQERIAQLEAMHRGVRTSSVGSPPIDADLLAEKLGDAIGERIETALADYEPGEGGAAPDRTAELVKTVTDALAPILALAASRLGPPQNGGGQLPGGGNGGGGGEGG